jgi:hypothetical protein
MLRSHRSIKDLAASSASARSRLWSLALPSADHRRIAFGACSSGSSDMRPLHCTRRLPPPSSRPPRAPIISVPLNSHALNARSRCSWRVAPSALFPNTMATTILPTRPWLSCTCARMSLWTACRKRCKRAGRQAGGEHLGSGPTGSRAVRRAFAERSANARRRKATPRCLCTHLKIAPP